MPIAGTPLGSDIVLKVLVNDPVTASQAQSVVPVNDNTNTTGKFGALVYAVKALLNPITNNKDAARAAAGTTGVAAVSTEGTKTTFSSASIAFTPAATATDFYTIIGSASKTVRVHRITVSGLATAAATVDIQLLKRSTADSGGASSAPAITPHDSNGGPTATAVISLWSANPTLGTLVGAYRTRKLNLGAAGSAGTIEWRFSDTNDQALVLRGVAENLALNWNGAAVPAGTSLDIEIEFVEDNS